MGNDGWSHVVTHFADRNVVAYAPLPPLLIEFMADRVHIVLSASIVKRVISRQVHGCDVMIHCTASLRHSVLESKVTH